MALWPYNSLGLRRHRFHFKTAIFNHVLLIGIFTSSETNALIWMPRDLTDDKSALVQVMAWFRQATSHNLNQCWLSSMSPHGVTRPQWVKPRTQRFMRSQLKIYIAVNMTLFQPGCNRLYTMAALLSCRMLSYPIIATFYLFVYFFLQN